ncbi:STAS domain-containing protein [Kitasatospora sp. NPDC051914]|uniref:STAS domain-containing protein n=1 Tax=Kitasatospora sp. NPDC051914 TaxID=3154945 RepID=UPI003413D48C
MASPNPFVQYDGPAADLEIGTASVGEAVACSFVGNLHLDNEAQAGRALGEALARCPTVLAVDLSAVRMFTSSGLNALLVARRAADADGVPLVLVAPSRSVRHVLQITDAHRVFPIFPTVEQALDRQNASPSPDGASGV